MKTDKYQENDNIFQLWKMKTSLEKMITFITIKWYNILNTLNDNIQCFKKDNIYTIKNDNTIYTKKILTSSASKMMTFTPQKW